MTPNLRSNQRKYDENIEYFERSEKMWAQFAAEDRLRSRAALVSDRKTRAMTPTVYNAGPFNVPIILASQVHSGFQVIWAGMLTSRTFFGSVHSIF
ncbi:hypothetical protein YC2023_063477 [Brassica napus]